MAIQREKNLAQKIEWQLKNYDSFLDRLTVIGQTALNIDELRKTGFPVDLSIPIVTDTSLRL